MNYYIDFDNTLYETARLTDAMISSICDNISDSLNKEELVQSIKSNFNSSKGNIYKYAKAVASKHNIEEEILIKAVDKILLNGSKYVYKDAVNYLEKIKEKGDKLIILTHIPETNQDYQMKKIIGSGISKYFEEIIITTNNKYELSLDYNNGIFIDDDVKNLEGLLSKNQIREIRIRKQNNKHSKEELENENVEEYESFDMIKIDWQLT